VVSSDKVFWKRLPPALVPDAEYDVDGVFSGSAGFQKDGTPIFFYTGKTFPESLPPTMFFSSSWR